MSSSALNQGVLSAKISNIQNAADSSAVYSNGIWSFKNSTALTSVTITDSGNVGIGTASPAVLNYGRELTVSNTSGAQPEAFLCLQGAKTVDQNVGAMVFFNSATPISSIATTRVGANNSGALTFSTANLGTIAERMRIDAAGSLKIAPNSIQGATTKGFSLRSISTDGGTNSANTYCTARYGAGKFVVLAAFDPSGNSVAATTAVGAGSTFIVLVTDAASNY